MADNFSAADVGKLRAMTGAGLMDCKKALVESGGDLQKAVDWLRKKGMQKGETKAAREIKAGAVFGSIDEGTRVGVLLEMGCETDFVARNEEFQALARKLLAQVAKGGSPTEGPALLEQPLQNGVSSGTIGDALKALSGKIGENVQLGRLARFEAPAAGGAVFNYLHFTGTVGVLLEIAAASDAAAKHDETKALAKDVCLHIAAMRPIALRREEVPADAVAREREVYAQSDQLKGKPENMIAKIVDGKLEAFFKDRCLLDQPFVKDQTKSVRDVVKSVAGKAGGAVELKRFALFSVGAR